MTTVPAVVTALADHPFLASIPMGSLRRLSAHVRPCTYAAGQPILREAEVANRLLLIRRGLVRLDFEVPGRGLVEVETLADGAALGWSWLFPPYRWQLSATALTATSTLVFDADALYTAMACDPVLGYELMRRFAGVIFDRLTAVRVRIAADG